MLLRGMSNLIVTHRILLSREIYTHNSLICLEFEYKKLNTENLLGRVKTRHINV